jgi:uncharacterized protein
VGSDTMKIAVTGSGGLIGSALVPRLRALGHRVVPVVRGMPQPGQVHWDPRHGVIAPEALEGIDAVVHLAGAGIGDHRWSAAYKQEIQASRVAATALLSAALAGLDNPPAVLLSGSAVGVYGWRRDELLTEATVPGAGFLAELCVQWEGATAPAAAAGIRVAHLRTGVVLSAAGGALRKQLLPFRFGLGARLASGQQQLSWISRRDVAAAISFLLGRDDISGAVNVTSPQPVSNATFTKALGRAVHRPAVLAVPRTALRLAVGTEMTSEFLLASQRAVPQRLLQSGFTFADPTLPEALDSALDDRALIPPSSFVPPS